MKIRPSTDDEDGIIEGGGRPTPVLPRGTGTPVPVF